MEEKPIRLFSSDLDNTLVRPDDSGRVFALNWSAIDEERRPLLCYNTGRLLDDTLKLIRRRELPPPDYIIAGVGTTIYDCRGKKVLKELAEILEEGWSRDQVGAILRQSGLPVTPQPDYFQTPFKSSWYLHNARDEEIDSLRDAMKEAGLEVNVIYSSCRDLDILPRWANKGNALKWLARQLKIPTSCILVAGDSGNDGAMFHVKGVRGIVVENAQPELLEATVGMDVYRSSTTCADGVMEGLAHFGLLREIRLEGFEDNFSVTHEEPEIQHLVDEESLPELAQGEIDFLSTAFEKAVDGLRRNMTPMGFSACSLEDNETRGTDANYRSVWARDGSITLIGALQLEDPELLDCSRTTLETLLDHLSPNGQVPANVRIDTRVPDYSGTGRIASIDSGIWLVIAIYEYARHTEDLDFLRKNHDRLQSIMNWISAHDSNNDALLEIPEAGDWTDLFGRSYNVLYDEVLWYRANLCFGRILEKLGRWKQAGDYLRWSRSIKNAILDNFWPTTEPGSGRQISFSDSQFSLGDTNYLIAQITPFSFDWRCDIYGNILAYLFNVTDYQKAIITFRFLWGVGASDPFPVSNLYPVVDTGDPGWRSYYTVNLLNLPHHYHNGGIWPFIGAQWVRFVHRLGLREIAIQELVKLAEVNQKGKATEWEFNEWVHGETGKPMGKAYQAWSCSEFIATCLELGIRPSGRG